MVAAATEACVVLRGDAAGRGAGGFSVWMLGLTCGIQEKKVTVQLLREQRCSPDS